MCFKQIIITVGTVDYTDSQIIEYRYYVNESFLSVKTNPQ